MVSLAELKEIEIFQDYTEEMLQKIQPLVESCLFGKDEMIFAEEVQADKIYMISQGKIVLEKKLSSTVTISMGAIKAGHCIGFSAIEVGAPFSMAARAVEKSTLFCIKGRHLLELFKKETRMGYYFMRRINGVMRDRIARLEERLFRSLKEHPDFKTVLN